MFTFKRGCTERDQSVVTELPFRNADFQHSVATLFRIVATLFQHCNAVLR